MPDRTKGKIKSIDFSDIDGIAILIREKNFNLNIVKKIADIAKKEKKLK